jgi:hypothetical protein
MKSQRRLEVLRQHLEEITPTKIQYLQFSQCSAQSLPAAYKRLIIKRKSNNYRIAAEVEETPMKLPTGTQILVQNKFCGIQASEIMISNGVVSSKIFLINN